MFVIIHRGFRITKVNVDYYLLIVETLNYCANLLLINLKTLELISSLVLNVNYTNQN